MSLKPWREVVQPHPDVATGRYRQAEFAADLAQVLRGTAEAEYQDAAEFFARTYITRGIERLAVEALRRLSGGDGEPVVQVKTAFGGGKTHAMLGLYHLFSSGRRVKALAGAERLMGEAGVERVPEARMAVLVGTALSATKKRQDMAGRGVWVRTLWGEMAAQLGGKEAYESVREDDRAGTAPDTTTLCELFRGLGPCLVLMDEIVAYIRNLWEVKEELVAGTFDANMTFLQSLTEAAKSSPGVMVIAAIPESDMETGGEGGRRALERVEHVFGRVEALWKAADASEGFEIVRRRLFCEVQDEAARDATCHAFHRLYCDAPSDFPQEAQTRDYLERLRRAYPIHPEVFDRLYEDWGALEKFQRTRGVLRLMAAVIHELWVHNDLSPLIMPGTLPLDAASVRTEITKHLSEPWGSIVDSDVDGENSEPFKIDAQNARLGATSATRRAARTIFLGSAPTVREQTARGLDRVRVNLGVAQPGDQLALFSDALSKMQERLTHLYSGSGRYWYDEQPNLRRTMEERAARITDDDVEVELEQRLREDKSRGSFRGVHSCPSSADVPDEQAARLVVLSPNQPHSREKTGSRAVVAATDILHQRGSAPRQYRNMLVFVAADESIRDLAQEVGCYLAWASIVDDHEALNLDAHQRKQAVQNRDRTSENVSRRLRESYCWLLVPTQEGTGPVEWEIIRMPGTDSIAMRASNKAESGEQLLTRWSPTLLRMELDKWLWKDKPHIGVAQLWEYLTTYCYLPRLQDQEVLLATIREGLRSKEWFGYAAGFDEEKGYSGLVLGGGITTVRMDDSSVLVKPEVAAEALRPGEEAEGGTEEGGREKGGGQIIDVIGDPGPEPAKAPTRFYGTIALQAAGVVGESEKVVREVLQHLLGLLGAEVTVKLDIEAKAPQGIPPNVVRTVSENCRTLGFEQSGFEED